MQKCHHAPAWVPQQPLPCGQHARLYAAARRQNGEARKPTSWEPTMLRSVIPCTTAGCSWQLGSRRGAQYHARERAGPFALPQLAADRLTWFLFLSCPLARLEQHLSLQCRSAAKARPRPRASDRCRRRMCARKAGAWPGKRHGASIRRAES